MDATDSLRGFVQSLSRGDAWALASVVGALAASATAWVGTRLLFFMARTARLRALRRTRVRVHARINKLRAECAMLRRELGGMMPVASSPSLRGDASRSFGSSNSSGDASRCYFCDETMPATALVCRHCEKPNVRRLNDYVQMQHGASNTAGKKQA
ncbi:MAG: hypothetical protein IPM60_10640 [Rhodospirillales bacterium]|nr:hypothetical protein [Rhodospirillales bacterium]